MWSSSVVEAALSGLKIEIFIQDPKCVNKLEYKGKAKIPGDMTSAERAYYVDSKFGKFSVHWMISLNGTNNVLWKKLHNRSDGKCGKVLNNTWITIKELEVSV